MFYFLHNLLQIVLLKIISREIFLFNRKYKCEECGYVTSVLVDLKKHQQTHGAEAKFFCDYKGCTAKFRYRNGYVQHLLKHEKAVHTVDK